jgi:hypothetical protein
MVHGFDWVYRIWLKARILNFDKPYAISQISKAEARHQ